MEHETNTAVLDEVEAALDRAPAPPTTTAEMVDYEVDRFRRAVIKQGEREALPITAVLLSNTANEDPESARYCALVAGLYLARTTHQAAEHEAGRKAKELEIREAIMAEKGVSATAAKELVKDDDRYTAYADAGRALSYERDVAEVIYEALKENLRALRAPLPMTSISLSDLFEKANRSAPEN